MDKITNKTTVSLALVISICGAIWFLSGMNSDIGANTRGIDVVSEDISEIKTDIKTLLQRK